MIDLSEVKNLSAASDCDVIRLENMKLRADKFKAEYEGTEISGMTFANMADNSFEAIYVQDIARYEQFPWEYFKGVFIKVKYEKISITDSLDTTKLLIKEISFGGNYDPESEC